MKRNFRDLMLVRTSSPACRIDRGSFLRATLATCALAAVPRTPALSASLDAARVTAYLASVRENSGIPAIGAAVARNGAIVYAGGSGDANLESDTPEDARTVFLIASISKTMSAIAVMQLVEAGSVSLDDPIQKFAPWFPQKEAPITVRHLMTHTSGIHHYLDDWDADGGAWSAPFLHYMTFEESTRFWRNDPLKFVPGTMWLYTTFGVAMLQAVIESASRMGLEEYFKRNIWQRAGMLATQLDVAGRIVTHRDQGYVGEKSAYERARDEDDSYKYAAGGVLSTDSDLCAYGAALNAGKLLKKSTIDEMYGLALPPDVRAFGDPSLHPGSFQALIWARRKDASGRTYMTHSGSGKGTISLLVNFPGEDLVIAVHRNSSEGPALAGIAFALADFARS